MDAAELAEKYILVLWQSEVVVSEQPMMRGTWAVDLLMRVYWDASEPLRTEIVRWFLCREGQRLRFNTPKFRKARAEFRALARKQGLEVADCRHVLNSPVCLDALSRQILYVPWGWKLETHTGTGAGMRSLSY
jgi:hypothetical protein